MKEKVYTIFVQHAIHIYTAKRALSDSQAAAAVAIYRDKMSKRKMSAAFLVACRAFISILGVTAPVRALCCFARRDLFRVIRPRVMSINICVCVFILDASHAKRLEGKRNSMLVYSP